MHQRAEAVGRARGGREEESPIEGLRAREAGREGAEREARGMSDWRRNAKYHCPLYIQEHNLTKLLAHSDLLPLRGRHRLVSHSCVRRRYFASSSLLPPRAPSPDEPLARRPRPHRRRRRVYTIIQLRSPPFPSPQRVVPALVCARFSRGIGNMVNYRVAANRIRTRPN